MGFYLHNLYLALNFLVFRCAKFILYIFGARVLPVSSFGLFSYAYTLMDIWIHFFGAGVDMVAARKHGEGDWPEIWKKTALIKFLASVIGFFAGFFWLPWPYSLIFGIWHLSCMQSKLAYSFVNTLLYPKGIVISGAIAETGLLVFALAATHTWGLVGFMGAFAMERSLEAGSLWFFAVRREPALIRDWSWRGLKEVFRELMPGASLIWATQLLGISAARLDSLVVKQLLGLEMLASYSLSFRAAEAPLFLFTALADSTAAYSIRHREEQEALYEKNQQRAMGIGALCAAALTVFALIAAEWVFGSKYSGIAPILAAYSWVLCLRGPNMVSSSFLMASKREKILLVSAGTGLTFNLAANWFLIPVYGIRAPVLIAIITESLIFLIRAKQVLKRFWLPAVFCAAVLSVSASILFYW